MVKLHEGGRYRPNNCIEKQLVLSEPVNVIQIWGGGNQHRVELSSLEDTTLSRRRSQVDHTRVGET